MGPKLLQQPSDASGLLFKGWKVRLMQFKMIPVRGTWIMSGDDRQQDNFVIAGMIHSS